MTTGWKLLETLVFKGPKRVFQRKSSIQTFKINYCNLKGQISKQGFIKLEAWLLSVLIWVENNFNGCEGLLGSTDLNILTVKKDLLNIAEMQTCNAVHAQHPEGNERLSADRIWMICSPEWSW